MIDVSVIIVCMNNVPNIRRCLDSIKKYTRVSYEVLVVAYLFSKENMEKILADYPWAVFIESNDIRGFSENNNLALKRAKGKYCFVINDDTEMRMPVIDRLVEDFEKLPEKCAIISPATYYGDGSLQCCGRPQHNKKTFILSNLGLWDEAKVKSIYTNRTGRFQSYNIVGAAFMIKRDVFEKFGWFDERFFFCPEDIALSSTLNINGYECWVDSNVELIHYEGDSGKASSWISTATKPAGMRGSLMFYSNGKLMWYVLLAVFCFVTSTGRLIKQLLDIREKNQEYRKIRVCSEWNTIMACLSRATPKELFIKFYNRIR